MVGYDEKEKELSSLQYAFAGSVSGIVSRMCLQPLDVLKIRQQIQTQRSVKVNEKLSFKYRGIFQSLRVVVKDEGVKALWKGHVPAQVLSIVYTSVQFASFEILTKMFWTTIPHDKYTTFKPAVHFLCGGLSGLCSTIVVQPSDVLRTRLVAQGEPKTYRGINHAIVSMYQENGIRTFYKGLVPTMMVIFPQMGLNFGFYTAFQTAWNNYRSTEQVDSNAGRYLVCGTASGIITKAIVYPLDVIKKRLQIEGFNFAEKQTTYTLSGVTSCVRNMLAYEGPFGFYKGIKVSIVKAGLVSGLSFLVYEECCKYIQLFNRQKELT